MDIKAVKFRKDGFYSQPFVFGGEEGQEKFDKNIRYRGSLQNYLIDTGNEVILVDTGLPAGFPDGAPEETAPIYITADPQACRPFRRAAFLPQCKDLCECRRNWS